MQVYECICMDAYKCKCMSVQVYECTHAHVYECVCMCKCMSACVSISQFMNGVALTTTDKVCMCVLGGGNAK